MPPMPMKWTILRVFAVFWGEGIKTKGKRGFLLIILKTICRPMFVLRHYACFYLLLHFLRLLGLQELLSYYKNDNPLAMRFARNVSTQTMPFPTNLTVPVKVIFPHVMLESHSSR